MAANASVPPDSDWIWEALALGEESLLKDAAIDYFDWSSSHEKYGTPLIALIVGKATGQEVYDFATGTPDKLSERLNLIKMAVSRGASPHAKPPPQFSICKSWWKTEGEKEVENSRTPLVQFNEKSAFGVVASCLEALTNVEGDWKREMRFLRDAGKILASYRPRGDQSGDVPTTVVFEGSVEIWEKMLNSGDGADVTLACQGARAENLAGSCQEACTELKAHRCVLSHASKVLRAMLQPGHFREGSSARIEVPYDVAAVKLLVSVIYTGEECEEGEPFENVLAALELAHQWDVIFVTLALQNTAMKCIDDDAFAQTFSVALRLKLQGLLSACEAFAKTSQAVKQKFKAAEFEPEITMELARLFGDGDVEDGQRSKRRRRAKMTVG